MVKRGTIPWEERARQEAEAEIAERNKPEVPTTISASTSGSNLSKDERAIKSSLDLAYKDWKGIPYVLGGSGYNGVDCSSFMQIVFEDYFQIRLPRNTREQMKEGSSVRRNRIKMGDMVFFKTGRDSYHVGVMVNEQQFLHASTSSGVMISGLQEKYWSDRYLTTRRIL
jgi:cell wall-associated NlpC family hydrolase